MLKAGVVAALFAAAWVSAPASAQDYRIGDLVIQHPWARATPKGAQVAGGYLTIVNHGATADTLTGGSLADAAKFEIHDMATENGVMTMRPTGPLAIPPGGTVTLAPAGRHIMFTGLRRGLTQGDAIDGTLTFAHAGTVPVRFKVEGYATKDPSAEAGTAMPGMDMH